MPWRCTGCSVSCCWRAATRTGRSPSSSASWRRKSSGHLYARECCANTWYAIGALRLRQGKKTEAQQAFAQALERVPNHRLVADGADGPSLSKLASKPVRRVFHQWPKAGTFDEQFGAAIAVDLHGSDNAGGAESMDGGADRGAARQRGLAAAGRTAAERLRAIPTRGPPCSRGCEARAPL